MHCTFVIKCITKTNTSVKQMGNHKQNVDVKYIFKMFII